MAQPDELVTQGQELLAKERGPSGAYLTISDQDLFGSMDLERPGLEQVRSAASSGDYASAYSAWGRYWAERQEPVYYLDEVDQSRPYYAKLLAWHDGKRATFVAASTNTYLKSEGVLHQRGILFVHGEYYFVFDRLVGGRAEMPLAWLLHSPKPLEEFVGSGLGPTRGAGEMI